MKNVRFLQLTELYKFQPMRLCVESRIIARLYTQNAEFLHRTIIL